MMIKGFIHDFIQAAKTSGITRLKFYAEIKDSRSLSVYHGELDRMERAELKQMFVEGEYQGYGGSVFLENFSAEMIPSYIDRIKESVQSMHAPFVPYALENLQQENAGDYRPAALGKVVEQMCCAEQTAYDADERIQRNASQHLTESGYWYMLADEKEQFVTDFVSSNRYYLSVSARDGASVHAGGKGAVFAGDEMPDMVQFAKTAAERAVSGLGAGSYPTGVTPVVLDSSVICELLDAFMPAFFAQSVRSRMSVLAGKLGQKVAGDNICIVEDPKLEGGLRNRSFDDEGVPTVSKQIVSKGVLACYLHNRQTALAEETVSGGNGFKTNFNEAVSTGYTNVSMQCGEHPQAQLLEMMGTGLLITGVSGVFAGVRPASGDFSLIANGFRVLDGKRGQAVKQITIAGNFFTMLEHVLAIGNDKHKMRGALGCVCTPSLYLSELAVSGEES